MLLTVASLVFVSLLPLPEEPISITFQAIAISQTYRDVIKRGFAGDVIQEEQSFGKRRNKNEHISLWE